MSSTTFKNLPDQSTPITAENLNNNIITVGLTANFTYDASDGEQQLPIDYVIASVGNKLTLDTTNNVIKIGAGITKIAVSFTVSTYTATPTTSKAYVRTRILKNGANVSRSDVRTEGMIYRPTMSMAKFVVSVQQNDEISIGLFSNNGALTTVAEYTGVNVTIEVVG